MTFLNLLKKITHLSNSLFLNNFTISLPIDYASWKDRFFLSL